MIWPMLGATVFLGATVGAAMAGDPARWVAVSWSMVIDTNSPPPRTSAATACPAWWQAVRYRSRTGKMLPPKLGLLSYFADAYLDGRSEDILLQPVSISFDQLHETAEYAAYARGGEKTPEGASWLYNFIKAQGDRNFGKIYVRFPNARCKPPSSRSSSSVMSATAGL